MKLVLLLFLVSANAMAQLQPPNQFPSWWGPGYEALLIGPPFPLDSPNPESAYTTRLRLNGSLALNCINSGPGWSDTFAGMACRYTSSEPGFERVVVMRSPGSYAWEVPDGAGLQFPMLLTKDGLTVGLRNQTQQMRPRDKLDVRNGSIALDSDDPNQDRCVKFKTAGVVQFAVGFCAGTVPGVGATEFVMARFLGGTTWDIKQRW